jgi:hypothetical protein
MKMTAKHLNANIGKTAILSVEKTLKVMVRILDCREVWGRQDYEITPLAGDGKQWVSADRVKVDNE